jgi:asparagine synthetase B (glutamine-hydrolysing)
MVIDSSSPECIEKLKTIKPQIFSIEQAISEYKRVLEEVISDETRDIKSCTACLSGGVDSTLVVTLLKDRTNLKTFTVGIKNSNDERFSKKFARMFDIPHYFIELKEGSIEDILEKVIKIIGNCGAMQIGSAISDYLVAEAAVRENESILFTGGGADVIFGGLGEHFSIYNQIKEPFHENFWKITFQVMDDDYQNKTETDRIEKFCKHFNIQRRNPLENFKIAEFARKLDARLNFDKERKIWKFVHRKTAVELGVPEEIAFRPQDYLQRSSGIFDLLAKVARKKVSKYCPDKGTNYLFGVDMVPPEVKYYLKSFALSRKL